jgi:hypothetical protein
MLNTPCTAGEKTSFRNQIFSHMAERAQSVVPRHTRKEKEVGQTYWHIPSHVPGIATDGNCLKGHVLLQMVFSTAKRLGGTQASHAELVVHDEQLVRQAANESGNLDFPYAVTNYYTNCDC